jgi:hypothetical protein
MIAVVCAVVKQLMELRRGREGNDNQQVGHEQAGECVLPRFGVSKPLHFHPFKALYRPSQNDCCKNNPPLFNEGVRKGLLQRLAVGCGYCLHVWRLACVRVCGCVIEEGAAGIVMTHGAATGINLVLGSAGCQPAVRGNLPRTDFDPEVTRGKSKHSAQRPNAAG